jgi:hypothetical protein
VNPRTPDMKRTRKIHVALGALLLAAGCADDNALDPVPTETDPTEPSPVGWEPGDDTNACNVDALLQAHAYGAKVKTLLTGLPLTDGELLDLENDPQALPGMIEGWLALPESAVVLERFFMTAFQQTSGDNASLYNLLGKNARNVGAFANPTSARADEMLNQSFAESFARTVTHLLSEGRSFSEVLTTDTFMMTTAQMSFLAFTDDEIVDDEQKHSVRTTNGHFDTITLVKDAADAPPLAQALNPSSPNFATFYHGALAGMPASCNVPASLDIDTTQNVNGQFRLGGGNTPSFYVFSSVVLGRHEGISKQGSTACNSGASNKQPLLQREDYKDYHLVKVRQPAAEEDPTLFYDIAAMRDATELVLHTPRIGFLTTPGFFSTWATNEDNSARVTINQALIVALGKSFEGVAVTDFSSEAIDSEHANPESECYGCHQTLDPMRDFYRASFSNFYAQQLDEERTSLEGTFVFRGVEESGNGVADLANILTDHPDFPYAWAQKLCFYANSAACPEGAELDRVVSAFRDADLDFQVLVRELFASPLVTGSACLEGVDSGTTASIARRSTFCSALSTRLGTPDVCGIRTHFRDGTTLQNKLRDAVASVPDDSFSRAVVEPVVISETSMFTRANTEATCTLAAQNDAMLFEGMTSDDATLAMVTSLMGLPVSDSRHAGALAILRGHVTEALAAEKTEEEALQSAFVLACMSPSVAGVGF